jgi:hypothetical protein
LGNRDLDPGRIFFLIEGPFSLNRAVASAAAADAEPGRFVQGLGEPTPGCLHDTSTGSGVHKEFLPRLGSFMRPFVTRLRKPWEHPLRYVMLKAGQSRGRCMKSTLRTLRLHYGKALALLLLAVALAVLWWAMPVRPRVAWNVPEECILCRFSTGLPRRQ